MENWILHKFQLQWVVKIHARSSIGILFGKRKIENTTQDELVWPKTAAALFILTFDFDSSEPVTLPFFAPMPADS